MLAKGQKGQTLIELMAAVAILAVAVVGLLSVLTVSLKTGRVSQDRGTATSLAEAELERVRNVRNSDPVSFFSPASSLVTEPCGLDVPSGFGCEVTYEYEGGSPPIYNEVKVSVNVNWSEAGNDERVMVSSNLTKSE